MSYCVFGKDKNGNMRGFGDMSSAELESILPFRMKLVNEKVINTNLKSQLKSLGEQFVFEANAQKQLEERFALFKSRDSPRESQKRRSSDIETSSRQGRRASRDFYNILIDEIVQVIEDEHLEDVVAELKANSKHTFGYF
ncbi:hypothetical protein GIB67_034693 [Kingdonia uniflora]|uniref:Uncharacterized protein n=1 Tax=Kingdonia uniflora TaxID=39325 RepID=A0A7J7P076_9MAGN|nr:hypothetical protein GIB67_034693 [Kingdonia uniflora]